MDGGGIQGLRGLSQGHIRVLRSDEGRMGASKGTSPVPVLGRYQGEGAARAYEGGKTAGREMHMSEIVIVLVAFFDPTATGGRRK